MVIFNQNWKCEQNVTAIILMKTVLVHIEIPGGKHYV